MRNQTLVVDCVVDLLSITGLILVNRGVMLLNIVIGQPQPEYGYAYTLCPKKTGIDSSTCCNLTKT